MTLADVGADELAAIVVIVDDAYAFLVALCHDDDGNVDLSEQTVMRFAEVRSAEDEPVYLHPPQPLQILQLKLLLMIGIDDQRAVAGFAQMAVDAHHHLAGHGRIQARSDDADHLAFLGFQAGKGIRLIIISGNHICDLLPRLFPDISAVEVTGHGALAHAAFFGDFFHRDLFGNTHGKFLLHYFLS